MLLKAGSALDHSSGVWGGVAEKDVERDGAYFLMSPLLWICVWSIKACCSFFKLLLLFIIYFILVGTMCSFPYREGRLCLGFNFSSALPRCWGFSLGLTRESLRYHFRLMVRRIWPWAQPLQPSQPIIFALPPAPVSIASLASGGRFDMLMPSGAPDSAEIILMLFFLTAALAAWIFT